MNRWLRLALFLPAVGFLVPVAAAQSVRTPASLQSQPPVSDMVAMLQSPGALPSRLRFDHLTSADGLSQDSVFAILQDRRGFMWFGTQGGLNRYDGYRVTQYRHNPRDPNSPAGDFIQDLAEDSRGRIWISGNGLTRFDPQTESFTRFALPLVDGREVAMQSMCSDESGFLWIGVARGPNVYRMDSDTGTVTAFNIAGKLPQELNNQIVGMYRDPAGILWLGSAYGLIRFDPATGAVSRYTPGGRNGSLMPVRGIARDREGKLWLASTEGGPNFFDPVAGTFARRWAAPNPQLVAVETNAVVAMADGLVWRAGTRGLEVFDPQTGANALLQHNAADPRSLSGNEILSLAADRDGNLWVGVKGGGVDRLSPDTLRFGAWRHNPADPRSLAGDNIRALYRDRAGAVWVGTYDDGLDRLDPASGSFTHFRHDVRRPDSLDDDRIYSIYEDRSGDLWVGTSFGLNRLNRRTGAFTHYRRGSVDQAGSGVPTYSLLEDSHGVFWFGRGENSGSLDRQTGAVRTLSVSGGLVIYEDRTGNLWLASASGFIKRDASGNIRTIPFPETSDTHTSTSLQINFMHEDSGGALWLAAETGLFRFDPKSERYTSYTIQEGLPDNVVQCILPDSAGNLWLSTNNGISRFNPHDSSFTNYHEDDGLQSDEFNRKSCFVDPAGLMYFGGFHGFNIFDPRRIAPPRAASRVMLTDFRIRGKAVPIRAGSVLIKPIWDTNAVNLSYRDEELLFEFASVRYGGQSRLRYRFKMENLESRWTEVDSRNRTARYTGLQPGKYRFHVQSSLDGRIWGTEEASLAISIAPPWWMTRWTQGGAILAFAGLLFGAYKLRVRALEVRELRLQKLIDRRTVELVEARDEAERANQAKSAFLANMTHELRTPLNAIMGFSGFLRDRSASEEQRRDLDIINRSGEHLLALINDVLDVAKIESGRTVLEFAPCDLMGLVRDVVDLMQLRAAEKHVSLILNETGEVPKWVRTDGQRLREILLNLVGNAVKYTERGTVTLRLSARSAVPGGQVLLRFDIEDTGIGIAREDQERIFQPFEQVAKGASQKGTGLGLAITRQIVLLMGGTIEVESAPGRGSCFRVEVPVALTEECEARPVRRERVLSLEAGQPEYRILVVEDLAENWMVLERLLKDTGFQVCIAEDGEQGVEIFQNWRPQFIWMDLRMPRLDGVDAARRIRKLEGGSEVKIAAVTASGFDSRRSEVLAAGLDDYIRKPYHPEEIFDCMARHLGVRYRRAQMPSPAPAAPIAELNPDAIAALPANLREELRAALTTLDVDRISATVREIQEHNSVLGSVLMRRVEKYSYTAILAALERSEDIPPSKSL